MLSSRTKTILYNLSRILRWIGFLIVVAVVIVEKFINQTYMLAGLSEHIAFIGAVMLCIGMLGEVTLVEEAGNSNSMTAEEFYQTYCLRCRTQLCKGPGTECPYWHKHNFKSS